MCLTKTRSGESQNVSLHTKLMKKPASSKFFGLKSVLEKLCFHVGLVSVDGRPNRKNKATFSNVSGGVDGTSIKLHSDRAR